MARVNLYKVVYHNNRHKDPQTAMDYVVAAAGSGAAAIASTIQTELSDGKSVTIDQIEVVRQNIIQ
jgi:hypothetical protein